MQRFIVLLLLIYGAPSYSEEPLRVAVAANFRPTIEAINTRYTEQFGRTVQLSSASTGAIANQLLYGAPFDIFFAADRETPEKLLQKGTGLSHMCYAQGSLVLVGGGLERLSLPDMSVAIGNPKTAPYGRAAMAVLARPEFAATHTVVRGNNVLQAYQFWVSGAADMALVARVLSPDATPLPTEWHEPIEQHLLVLNESPAVSDYLQFLQSDTVRAMITDAGYLPCP